ncbi:MAG: hypothetical protein CMO71_08370 [Verrucomicrobiales bacterium]|nr:hypothetical protein [Verrucomicrobiales bacterium]
MAGFIRFIGIFNIAVWVGGSVFFSFLAGSVFFSPEVTRFTPPPYNGLVAQAMLERFFMLHYICGILGIAHLLIECFIKQGTFPKKGIIYVGLLLLLAIIGGKLISPNLNLWHQQKYQFQIKTEGEPPMIEFKPYAKEIRQTAKLKFTVWHGISQTVNLIMLLMLLFYFWKLVHPTNSSHLQTYSQKKRNLFSE